MSIRLNDERLTTGWFLDFDKVDWALLLGGIILAGLLPFLIP